MKPLPCPYCGKPARAWLVRCIDGAYWVCGCRRDDPAEPMCFIPLPESSDTEDEAVAAWNATVEAERDRIDSLVGYVSPLDYAWAKRRHRRAPVGKEAAR